MPAPATVDEFVDLIRKSAVLDEARLAPYVERLKADPDAPRDLNAIAGLFVRDGLLTFFQAEQFLQGKWKRFTIGKYKVLERLGSGGMGQVFLCEHKLMRRRVAVKVLPTQKAADPSSLERFYREARAVAALDHPNIVRAYDIDQDDNLHFLVMEYVDGASLQEMIRKTGPMDPTRACHYMYWSAVGLQHAHQQGLIHRDIKPGNILVDRTGVVKILDLGLARFFNDDEDLLTKKYDESVLGTADYLAPEQAVDSHTVDGRADIYSLGATFYFLLTGQPPFAEGTVAQKLLWHQSKNPKAVREVRPQVPDPVAQVVARMMAKKPEDRYQTPGELADALLPFTQTPIPPPPDEEMPTLSAAALGTSAGPASVTAAPPPRTTMSSPRTPPPVRGRKPAPATHPFPVTTKPPPGPPGPAQPGNNGVPVADADTQRRANPAPVVEPIPEAPPVAPIWEAIGAETANTQRGDTDRKRKDPPSRRPKSAPKSSPKTAKPGEPERKRRLTLPLILTIVGGVVLLGVAVALVYYFVFRGPPQKGSPAPRTMVIGNGKPGDLVFKTIGQALATGLNPGDTIELEVDIDEAIYLTQIKNVTIKAAEGKKITWRAPGNRKNDPPPLALNAAEETKVIGIKFDADNRLENAVVLSGSCPGLVLERVEMVNAKGAALVLHDTRGVIIRNCVLNGGAGESAVVFKTGGRFMPSNAQPVLLDRCLIYGPPAGAMPTGNSAVRFEGNAAAELRHCRVYQGDFAVRFPKAGDRTAAEVHWQVKLTRNTFHSQAQAAVVVDDSGQFGTRTGNRLELEQNFFAGSPVAVRLDNLGLPPPPPPTPAPAAAPPAFLVAKPNSNVRKDPPTPPQPPTASTQPPTVPPVQFAVSPADVSLDPDPAKFLTYDKASPLNSAAANSNPAGAAPG